MPQSQRRDIPPFQDLIYPVLKAVDKLGGSAQGREIIPVVIDEIGASDDLVAITYHNRPKSVLVERIRNGPGGRKRRNRTAANRTFPQVNRYVVEADGTGRNRIVPEL
jgi:hypothetical protein